MAKEQQFSNWRLCIPIYNLRYILRPDRSKLSALYAGQACLGGAIDVLAILVIIVLYAFLRHPSGYIKATGTVTSVRCTTMQVEYTVDHQTFSHQFTNSPYKNPQGTGFNNCPFALYRPNNKVSLYVSKATPEVHPYLLDLTNLYIVAIGFGVASVIIGALGFLLVRSSRQTSAKVVK